MLQLSQGDIHAGDVGYNETPSDNDKMHCVALVIDAETVSGLPMAGDIKEKIEEIRDEAEKRGE